MNSVLENQPQLITDSNELLNVSEKMCLPTLSIKNVQNKPVILNFDGGALSSDAGILLLKEVEEQINIIQSMTEVITDNRDSRYIKHTIKELLFQRISQIACGYEDANDCNELRYDPIFKILCDRLPESGDPLASQPTMTRFENAISRSFLYRLARVFADAFIASYEKEPSLIVLDFDDSEDKVHGNQQLALFNNFYKDYCYAPLHVFEGISGKLITSILKPGKRLTGKQTLAIVKRLIRYLRNYWPNTVILFRGDGHFSYHEVHEWIDEQENVNFVTGYAVNSVLKKLAEPLLERARRLYNQSKRDVRLFHTVYYKAGSWAKHRRVIIKVEINHKGQNIRCIVTDLYHAGAKELYQTVYCGRGNAELYIKDLKLYLKSDRTSCHRFMANQFRLLLHSAAYVLIHALRTNILRHTQWEKATISTIRLRLFKIGAKVQELKTRIKIELPSGFPLQKTLSRCFQMFELLRAG